MKRLAYLSLYFCLAFSLSAWGENSSDQSPTGEITIQAESPESPLQGFRLGTNFIYPDYAASLELAYRINPNIAAGVHGHLGFISHGLTGFGQYYPFVPSSWFLKPYGTLGLAYWKPHLIDMFAEVADGLAYALAEALVEAITGKKSTTQSNFKNYDSHWLGPMIGIGFDIPIWEGFLFNAEGDVSYLSDLTASYEERSLWLPQGFAGVKYQF
ncbi:MAG: hypothetical protein HY391_02865 [Deltaproteobacteria bacterium]|nr:hypothetical protein [Deltaproteobacteria bacterium]